MLIRLLPDQIPDHWETIKRSLDDTLIVIEDNRNYNEILEKLLIDQMICWIIVGEGDNQICGLAITTTTKDEGLNYNGLLLYSFNLFNSSKAGLLKGAFISLMRYAKSIGCKDIYAFSNIPEIYQMAKRLGADIETRRISFKIGE